MTFTAIVSDIMDRLNLTSSDAQTRLGREVNRYYRRLRTALGLQDATMRAVAVSVAKSLGSATVTFTGVQKITRVYDDTSGSIRLLTEKHWDELREKNPGTSDPTEWAVQSHDDDSVTILLNVLAQDTDVLKADGFLTTSDLSGSAVPAFPEDFHDILIEGVLADEYRKRERLDLAKISKAEYEARLSDLRMWFAKSLDRTDRQGELAGQFTGRSGSSGGGGGAPSGGTSYTQTGLITFDRDPSAPFAVTDTSAYVPNLFTEGVGNVATDRLIGRDTAGTGESEQLTVGGGIEFTGSGGIQIANDAVTFAKMQNVSAASRLLGRGSAAGAGDPEEISLGADLSMSATTVNINTTTVPLKADKLSVFAATTSTELAGVLSDETGSGGGFVRATQPTLDSPNIDDINLTGGQIVFPATQNASAGANTLDDYEEGTWTPAFSGSGGQSGQVYSSQSGQYTKIGETIFASGRIVLSTLGTITGNVRITGLPFAVGSSSWAPIEIGLHDALTTAVVWLGGYGDAGTSVIELKLKTAASTTMNAVSQGDLSNTTQLIFSMTYRTS